jgi:type IV secretion system protein VirB4
MALANSQRKSDKHLYNENAEEYIPLACHYDTSTLLTKNGELIQTIEISGMSSDMMVTNLNELTRDARISLAKHITSSDVACWIHTISRKQNIDDTLQYSNKFSSDLHEVWVNKNRIRAKFVNIVYITVVMKGMAIYLNNATQITDSTSNSTIIAKHETYLAQAAQKLYSITGAILEDLSIYGASRLGIRIVGERTFSDPLYLYSHILSFDENDVEVPVFDFSKYLAIDRYAVGSRQIEVINKGKQKFASILSLREYHNAGQEDLFAKTLQSPIEFIATEIFYPIDKKEVQTSYEYQNYILGVTRDDQLQIAKGLDITMDSQRTTGFIKQQLSIMIISDNIEELELNTKKFSKSLAKIGVVHVREDINLENIFWSQLPGNFHYIRRSVGGVSENIGPFLSLQHTPHGRKFSRWGRYITVIPSILGTPYFTNFHSERKTGHACFFGNFGSGKTTLMNFFVSETMKYNPTIIYLSLDHGPKLFVNALGGEWLDTPQIPALAGDSYIGVEILVDILSGQYSKGVSTEEKKILDTLLEEIRKSGTYNAAMQIVENFDFQEAGKVLKASILKLTQYFKAGTINITSKTILGISLKDINNPEDYDLRAAFVIAALRSLGIDKDTPKLLIMDEMADMLDHPYFTHNMNVCYDLAEAYNIALIGTVDTDKYINVSQKQLWNSVDNNLDLKVLMPHENINYNLKEIFGLTDDENKSLGTTQYDNIFIMKPFGRRSIIAQFNSVGLETFIHILSGSEADLQHLSEIQEKYGKKPEDWLPEFYKILEK